MSNITKLIQTKLQKYKLQIRRYGNSIIVFRSK